MLEKLKNGNILLLAISALFVGLNAIFLYFEIYYFMAIPFLLLIAGFAIFSTDKLFFIIVFFTPLSVSLDEFIPGLPVNMFLPTEPLLLGLMFIVILKLAVERKIDKRLVTHPISIAIYFYLIWMFFTSFTSSMPAVSFKYIISKLWFIIPIFFLGTQIFSDYKKIKPFIIIYSVALLIVIIYTTYNHANVNIFEQNASHHVAKPFYNDHTAYGAVMALLLPVLIGLVFYSNYKINFKLIILGITSFVLLALVLSYSRAAWISFIGLGGVWLVVKLKINYKVILTVLTVVIILFSINSFFIFDMLSNNDQDSSADFSKQITSATNVSTDASNLERINRWNCAIRMFKERPVFGWGPGTYMFQYAPFQISYEKTIISTNMGRRGNAHSEYLGPLAEEGVLGMITFLILAITIISTGIKVYHNSNDKEIKMLAFGTTLGLISYFVHGFLNNFLDTDKLSVPFWGFTAIIVALDIYHKKEMKNIGKTIEKNEKLLKNNGNTIERNEK